MTNKTPSCCNRRDTGLAEALAYGDPDLARHVLSVGLDAAGTMAAIIPEYLGDVAQAMCRIDPAWGIECARSQEDAATASVFRLYVAQELGELLGSTSQQQEQRLLDVYEPHGAWLP